MKTVSARQAKDARVPRIETVRAEAVVIEKHGRAVVMVIAGGEDQRLVARVDSRGAVGEDARAERRFAVPPGPDERNRQVVT